MGWNDLGWVTKISEDKYKDTISLTNSGYIDLDKPLNVDLSNVLDTSRIRWNSNAADIAYITLRKPDRIAIHGSEMMNVL